MNTDEHGLVGRDSVEPSWFFSDESRLAALTAAIAECTPTPFAKFGRVPGREGGLDCVGFVEYSLGKAGAGQGRTFEFGRSSADYQSARSYLRILHYLRGTSDDPQSKALAEIFAEIPLPIPQGPAVSGKPLVWENPSEELFVPGDLAILRDGGMFHLPIMTGGRGFVHCMNPGGVQTGNMHDPTFSNHLIALFRARKLATDQHG